MTKICFVTTICLTYHCFLEKFSEYLHNTGEYDISLICDEASTEGFSIPDYVHYYPVRMKRGISLSGIAATNKIRRILAANHFDIVQYSTPNAALYTSLAARRAHVPARIYCQWGIRYMGFHDGLKRTVFKHLEKFTCRNSTFIEAESHNIRSFSLTEGLYDNEKSAVIWNGSASGVDLAKFDVQKKPAWRNEIRTKYGIDPDNIVFAFAGRLTKDKGVNELLEAYLRLSESHTNTKLFLCGGMDDRRSLNAELYALACENPSIIMTGNVSDIEKYYAASDVFIAPSYREGFGLVVVEAEAMELPAIVSDVPGQIDAIEENVTGISCRVKDPDALFGAMEELLNNERLREKMGAAAAKFASEKFEQNELFRRLKAHRDELMQCQKSV